MNQKSSGSESRSQGVGDRDESKTLSGAERWELIRRRWLEPPNESKVEVSRKPKVIAKAIDVDDVIERIFSTSKSNSAELSGLLKEPLPLAQMIDILTDFWEADGLYD
eukprot:gene29500-39097_t